MDLTEKKLSGELKYTGVIVSVTLDKVELCDGHQTLREVVHHPGGVGHLARGAGRARLPHGRLPGDAQRARGGDQGRDRREDSPLRLVRPGVGPRIMVYFDGKQNKGVE